MPSAPRWISCLLATVVSAAAAAAEPVVLYVSPQGNDAWSGTLADPKLPPPPPKPEGGAAAPPPASPQPVDGPFATLERARDEARKRKAAGIPEGGIEVRLRAGLYNRADTFRLGAGDSGTEMAPVVWRAHEREEVRLAGGREIPATAFKPVDDPAVTKRLDAAARGKVLQADLKALGITDLGELKPRGFGPPKAPAALELFFQDLPMPLAGWPNDGWGRIAGAPAGPNGGRFTVEGDRPKRWAGVEDVWLHGYWTWDWADSYCAVASIDPAKSEIVTKPPHGTYGYTKGKRFRALNLLEELDAPGEWVADRKSGLLYFWPPKPLVSGRVLVSILDRPLVALEGASWIVLRGLVLECVRGDVVTVTGGEGCRVAGCTVRNAGNDGIVVHGGTRHGVMGCDVTGVGETGIALEGGDRKTLTPGGHYATNNHVWEYSRWCRTYRPAVRLGGVGLRVANNLFHDAPHNAILFGGNEHVLELNEVYNVCRETGDAGAFYIGRDWTMRGNVVRHNLFHHLEGVQGQEGFTEIMAVYLDDAASGTTVSGNICYRVTRAVMVGGGRDNAVENNVFVECPIAVHVDARGIGWAKKHIQLEGGDWGMKGKLEAVKWKEPPYSVKYPRLAVMLDEEPYFPKGTVVARNVAWKCGRDDKNKDRWLELQDKLSDKTITIKDNLVGGEPGIADPAKLDFRLSPASPAFKLGFQKIPLEKIGLQKDEDRPALPKIVRPG